MHRPSVDHHKRIVAGGSGGLSRGSTPGAGMAGAAGGGAGATASSGDTEPKASGGSGAGDGHTTGGRHVWLSDQYEPLDTYDVGKAALEVLRPLEVTFDGIEAVQEDFCRMFPFDKASSTFGRLFLFLFFSVLFCSVLLHARPGAWTAQS